MMDDELSEDTIIMLEDQAMNETQYNEREYLKKIESMGLDKDHAIKSRNLIMAMLKENEELLPASYSVAVTMFWVIACLPFFYIAALVVKLLLPHIPH